MILLDTHAWVWFVSNPEYLSKRANKKIREAVDEKGIIVSSISVWEVALLAQKKRLVLSMDPGNWIVSSESLPFLHFISVDNAIALRSVNLPEPFHPDPADRIIVSTAMIHGAAIVTKDARIRKYPHVKTIW